MRDQILTELEIRIRERERCCMDVCHYCQLGVSLEEIPMGESTAFVHHFHPNSVALPCAATGIRRRGKQDWMITTVEQYSCGCTPEQECYYHAHEGRV